MPRIEYRVEGDNYSIIKYLSSSEILNLISKKFKKWNDSAIKIFEKYPIF